MRSDQEKGSLSPSPKLALKSLAQFLLAIALLSSAGSLLSQDLEYQTLSGKLETGANAFARGDYRTAADQFLSAREIFLEEPEWSASRLDEKVMPLAGFAALKAGMYEDAVSALELVLETEPSSYSQQVFARYSIALALLRQGRADEALGSFAEFRQTSHSPSHKAIASIQEAKIHFSNDRIDEGMTRLMSAMNSQASSRVKAQARLQAIKEAIAIQDLNTAKELLLDHTWRANTMPEIALLTFLSIKLGDSLLEVNDPTRAMKAYRLAKPKEELIDEQQSKLADLKKRFNDRKSGLGFAGAIWEDFYSDIISGLENQLNALLEMEDYSIALELRKGHAFLQSQRPFEAWLIFERHALSKESRYARESHYYWISSARAAGLLGETIAIANEFLKRYPDSQEIEGALFQIAQAYLDSGQLDNAIATFDALIERTSNPATKASCHFQKGICYASSSLYEKARSSFNVAANLEAAKSLKDRSQLWIGLCYFFENQFAEALVVFESLEEELSGSSLEGEVAYRIATCLYPLSRYIEAKEKLKLFDELPGHERQFEALLLNGDCDYALGDLESALHGYQKIPSELDALKQHAALQIHHIHLDSGEVELAKSTLRQRFKETRNPDFSAETATYLIELELDSENYAAAKDIAERSIERAGNTPFSENLLAVYDYHFSLIDDESEWKKLIDSDFENDRIRSAARRIVTQALHLKSDQKPFQAQEILVTLASRHEASEMPVSAVAYTGLALIELDPDRATTLLQEVINNFPNSSFCDIARYGMAKDAYQKEQYDLAIGWVNQIARRTLYNIDSQLLKARSHYALREFNPAIDSFKTVLSDRESSSDKKAIALYGIAECKRELGETKQAIAYCQRVFTLYPSAKDIAAKSYFETGKLLFEIEEFQKSHEVLEEFLDSDRYVAAPSYQDARKLIAKLETKMPKTEGAIQ